jgi:alkylation response protein AidB-like acyl-CoA dehydrogenase
MPFTAPASDIAYAMNRINGFDALVEAGRFGDLGNDLIAQILEEAGRFATDVLAPLNRIGDTHGTRLEDGEVTTAPGWKDAYARWVEGGWGTLPCETAFGGQHLPISVSLAVQEIWNTANSAFGIGTLLTQGAVEAITVHGSDDLKRLYLERMVSGEWTGTMNLTEPQAGSDLNALRARAEPHGDGTYRIKGTKIFITYGDHDLTGNIIHLVLARLPDAPPGTRGISLFLVPKFLLDKDGAPAERNDVVCAGLEEKLGIHGSPTCVLSFGEADGAVGWLVGEENRGLACMFTMMNTARLHVGMQGVAIAERAFQQALDYARERRQGRREGTDGMVAIIEHPDVKRMLTSMKGLTAAARSILYATARAIDLSHYGETDAERRQQDELASLLTPIAKAFGTDVGVEVASLGLQVHGGMGFIEETGAAQHYRDARITPIYEGTNGIQAIDLATRKIPMRGGEVVQGVIAQMKSVAEAVMASNDPAFGRMGYRLNEAVEDLEEATDWMLQTLQDDQDQVLAAATPYLRLFGLAAGGTNLAAGALATAKSTSASDGGLDADIALARYFAENHLPDTRGLSQIVRGGGSSLLQMTSDLISA